MSDHPANDAAPSQRRGRLVGAGLGLLALAGAAGAAGAVAAGDRVGAVAGASAPAAGTCPAGVSRLTVAGVGQATATPNLLTLSLGVSVTAPGAAAALAADGTTTAAVVAALTAGGVRPADIQTANLSVQPQYAQTGGAITGYAAQETVVAKVRDIARAGSVIDAAVTAGGNATRLQSVTFSVSNAQSLQDRARAAAVRQAVAHAGSMAKAAGERLGTICSVKDASTTAPPVWPFGRAAFGAATPSSASVPVQAGTEQVTDHVTVVYALVPRHGR